jgi:hypothetical protein
LPFRWYSSSSFNEPTGTNPLSATAINSRLLHAAPLGANAAAIPPEKKPPTVNALMKELEKQRAEKASLENKSAGLRKRLQQMLIDCDEVRVRASAEVQVVKDKAQREVEAAQRALVEARAQLRLADRAPDFGRIDSAVDDLEAARIQIEKLKQADSERTALFNARCSMENRLAEREARRLLDVLTADGCAQLRIIARRQASSSGVANGTTAAGGATDVVTITREGVRRLAFLKFFGLPHDFLHYMSPSFQSLDVLRHEVDRDQLVDLFGSAMRHEERAGLFYVAAAPMVRNAAIVLVVCIDDQELNNSAFCRCSERDVRPSDGDADAQVRVDRTERDPRARAQLSLLDTVVALVIDITIEGERMPLQDVSSCPHPSSLLSCSFLHSRLQSRVVAGVERQSIVLLASKCKSKMLLPSFKQNQEIKNGVTPALTPPPARRACDADGSPYRCWRSAPTWCW